MNAAEELFLKETTIPPSILSNSTCNLSPQQILNHPPYSDETEMKVTFNVSLLIPESPTKWSTLLLNTIKVPFYLWHLTKDIQNIKKMDFAIRKKIWSYNK